MVGCIGPSSVIRQEQVAVDARDSSVVPVANRVPAQQVDLSPGCASETTNRSTCLVPRLAMTVACRSLTTGRLQ
jgi:hypothetical protein